MRRIPSAVVIPALAAAAVASLGLSLLSGSVPMAEATPTILWEIRLGRGVLTFLVGTLLGASGVLFQGLFRNPLADPFVVGVSGGAALGAVAAMVLGVEATLLGLGARTLAAFGGGLGAAYLAWRLACVRGRVPLGSLLLAGFAVATFTGSAVSILLFLGQRNWHEVIAWLMGHVDDTRPWDRVKVILPVAAASLAAMAAFARDLDLLLLGEESAGQLGVEVERAKGALLAAGAVAAAAAVAVCGIIGFVGLVVPHVARALVGPRHRTLLPVTVLAGGTILTLADVLSRVLTPGSPLPIGAVMALLGAPFFVWMLRRKAIRA